MVLGYLTIPLFSNPNKHICISIYLSPYLPTLDSKPCQHVSCIFLFFTHINILSCPAMKHEFTILLLFHFHFFFWLEIQLIISSSGIIWTKLCMSAINKVLWFQKKIWIRLYTSTPGCYVKTTSISSEARRNQTSIFIAGHENHVSPALNLTERQT